MKKKQEKFLQKLADLFAEDQNNAEPDRRYPHQALPALHDIRVLTALSNWIEDDHQVLAVFTLGFNPFTKLHHTVFAVGKESLEKLAVGVLAITDSACKVVGVVDRFEIPEAGTTIRLPIERSPENQPFVLQQPSVAEQILHVGQPVQSQAGMSSQPGLVGLTPYPGPGGTPPIWGGSRFPGRIPGGVDGGNKKDTPCSYDTTYQTLIGTSCKQRTGISAFACDAWGNDYAADSQQDTEVDDCGEDSLFGTGLVFPW